MGRIGVLTPLEKYSKYTSLENILFLFDIIKKWKTRSKVKDAHRTIFIHWMTDLIFLIQFV